MPPVLINYALFTSKIDVDERDMFEKFSNGQVKLLTSIEEADETPGALIKCEPIQQRPLPPNEALAYFSRGFSQADGERLKRSKTTISILGVGPFDSEHRLLKELTMILGRMAQALDAFIFDLADSLIFTPMAFQEHRTNEIEAGELSAAQFGVRAYRDGQGLRSVTMGLEKFGQPNLCIPQFPEHLMGPVESMMMLATQHIIESSSPVGPGMFELDVARIRSPMQKADFLQRVSPPGSGKATLRLDQVEPTSGDPQELLGPIFDAAPGESLWREQESILGTLFGAVRKVSEGVELDDLEEAMAAARAKAVAILKDKKKWTAPGREFRVAVNLPKTREIVWVQVQSWRFGRGKGILLSKPNAPGYRSGANVKFNAKMIMDYRLSDPEGDIEAGGIDELVQRRQA